MNGRKESAINGAMQTGTFNNKEGFILLQNPSHGYIGDLLESGFDKLLGAIGVKSAFSRGVRKFVERVNADHKVKSISIAAHSQGTLLVHNALKGFKLDVDIKDGNDKLLFTRDIRFGYSGSPVDAIKAHDVIWNAGIKNEDNRWFQVNRPDKTIFGFPKTDAVADLIGGNAKYSENPIGYHIGSILSLPSLFASDSPHSNYACSICNKKELNPINRQIYEKYNDTVLIHSDGSFNRRDEQP